MIKELENRQHLIQYLRDKNGNPIGTMLAIKNNEEIIYGWSCCGRNKKGQLKDKFDKNRGQFIAMKRAESIGLSKVPPIFQGQLESFLENCKEWFLPRIPKIPTHKNQVSYKNA